MAGLKLSLITGPHERVMPMLDGRVPVEGVDEFITTFSDASVTFWRVLNFEEYEVSEMSMSSYLIARSHGADMVAIPVFPTRRFMHMGQSINTDSGVETAGDLVGKRIGVGVCRRSLKVDLAVDVGAPEAVPERIVVVLGGG